MAQGATVYSFEVQLADVDRSVYEALSLRLARQASETPEYLLTRALAYCLEYTDGIASSAGLADPEEPSLAVRDLTGALRVWIEIGAPDAARLHKASKASPRVVLYTHKDAALQVRLLAGERIHRAEAIEIYALDREFLAQFVTQLERRMVFELAVSDRHLYVTLGDVILSGEIRSFRLGDG